MMSQNDRSTPHVELSDVSKVFPGGRDGFRALDHIDLVLPAGELIAIVGKSGCGKSTLLHLVAGIDRPSQGEIRVGDCHLGTLDESRLAAWRGRQVGVVFQSFQLLPTLTVVENVALPMDFCHTLPARKARQRALELLDRVGIADQAQKLPLALSGGQQQRAAIARALANDPPLLVADEPTGNLDSQSAGKVFDLLTGLVRQGKTVLLVTHDREVVRSVDRVVYLADGRVVDEGPGGLREPLVEVRHA